MANDRKRKYSGSPDYNAQLEDYASTVNGHAYIHGIRDRERYQTINALMFSAGTFDKAVQSRIFRSFPAAASVETEPWKLNDEDLAETAPPSGDRFLIVGLCQILCNMDQLKQQVEGSKRAAIGIAEPREPRAFLAVAPAAVRLSAAKGNIYDEYYILLEGEDALRTPYHVGISLIFFFAEFRAGLDTTPPKKIIARTQSILKRGAKQHVDQAAGEVEARSSSPERVEPPNQPGWKFSTLDDDASKTVATFMRHHASYETDDIYAAFDRAMGRKDKAETNFNPDSHPNSNSDSSSLPVGGGGYSTIHNFMDPTHPHLNPDSARTFGYAIQTLWPDVILDAKTVSDIKQGLVQSKRELDGRYLRGFLIWASESFRSNTVLDKGAAVDKAYDMARRLIG